MEEFNVQSGSCGDYGGQVRSRESGSGVFAPRVPLGQSACSVGLITTRQWRTPMAWTTPTLVEICIGLEINGYLPAEF
jgi:coenzyme PQQ precursor peptide PqqA